MAALVGVLVFCLSGSASAQQTFADQPISVRSLYEDCKGSNVDFCLGYLAGIAKTLDTMRIFFPKFGEEYCPPPTGGSASYREVFMTWAEHSNLWNAKSFDGAYVAFWTKWFCDSPNL
jgi:hypothetical protein